MILNIEELKAHLNVTADDDDELIEAYGKAAEGAIENYIGKPFTTYFDDETQAYSVPEPLKQSVRMITAHFYENRENVLVGVNAQSLPFGAFDLALPYREWVF